jgi:hypothetical protein
VEPEKKFRIFLWDVMEEDLQEKMRLLNLSNKKFYRDVGAFCKKTGFKEDNVLGLYLYGSRLWGTAVEASDYDFLVVLKKAESPCQTFHSGNIDCLVFSQAEFDKKLGEHMFLCVVVAAWLPEEWVWKRKHPIKFKMDRKKLIKALLDTVDRDWKVAAKKRSKKLNDAAAKVEMHAIRQLRVLVELLISADPIDKVRPTLANCQDVWQVIKQDYEGTWSKQYLEEEKLKLEEQIKSLI